MVRAVDWPKAGACAAGVCCPPSPNCKMAWTKPLRPISVRKEARTWADRRVCWCKAQEIPRTRAWSISRAKASPAASQPCLSSVLVLRTAKEPADSGVTRWSSGATLGVAEARTFTNSCGSRQRENFSKRNLARARDEGSRDRLLTRTSSTSNRRGGSARFLSRSRLV